MSEPNDPIAVSVAAAGAKIPAGARLPFAEAMRHGTMMAGLYTPRGTDPQQPHTRDEIYVVVSGTGHFVRGDERVPFGPGDLIFVAAGAPHRFEDFSEDFQTWVVFWGPECGEH